MNKKNILEFEAFLKNEISKREISTHNNITEIKKQTKKGIYLTPNELNQLLNKKRELEHLYFVHSLLIDAKIVKCQNCGKPALGGFELCGECLNELIKEEENNEQH